MSQRSPEKSNSNVESRSKAELERNLEKPKVETELPKVEREQSVEKAREKIRQANEKKVESENEPKPEASKLERKPLKRMSRAEKRAVYATTMKSVQAQLPPIKRNFSRFVHSRPVEYTSELLEETIYRPSFLIGGGLGALILGGGFYAVAKTQGWLLSGSEFSLSLIVGGLIGWLIELILRRIKPKK